MNAQTRSDSRLESAEHVLPGHPDKLCDAAVDGIVEAMRKLDPYGQCGMEMACVFDQAMLTGRLAAHAKAIQAFEKAGGADPIIRKAYEIAGYGHDSTGRLWGPHPKDLHIVQHLCFGPFEDEDRELRHLSDDQSICVGYAYHDARTNHLPPAVWLSRRIAKELYKLRPELAAGEAGPDGKVLVQIQKTPQGWHPTHVSLSISHHENSDWMKLRKLGEAAVEAACAPSERLETGESWDGCAVPPIILNHAGMFISVGPNGDNGLSGKKLVVDAYGASVPIGGGAWSGKDLHKPDRVGGLLARNLAKEIQLRGSCEEVLVTLDYHPGSSRPESAVAELGRGGRVLPVQEILGDINMETEGTWSHWNSCRTPLDDLARWGHQQPRLPWEMYSPWF
jgi:S-adenosylmethionine synthetase